MDQEKFASVFRRRLRDIERGARLAGINMTVVCAEANVGRATPNRWRRGDVPLTIEIIDKMEAVVKKHMADAKRPG